MRACVEIPSKLKGDQKPKDKAMRVRAQMLVGVEHGTARALRKGRETEGRAVNPGRWVSVLVELTPNANRTSAREDGKGPEEPRPSRRSPS